MWILMCAILLVIGYFYEKNLTYKSLYKEVEDLRDLCDEMVKIIDSELGLNWCVDDLISDLSCDRWRSLPCAGDSNDKLQEKKKNFIGVNFVLNKMIEKPELFFKPKTLKEC